MALQLQVIAPVHLQAAGSTITLPFSGTVAVNSPVSGNGAGTFNIDPRDIQSATALGCWWPLNTTLQVPATNEAATLEPAGVIAAVIGTQTVCCNLIGANMNVTTDQQFNWGGLNGNAVGGSFLVTGQLAWNPSISLTTAAGGAYNTTGKSGVLIAAATVYSSLTVATSAQLTAAAATSVFTYQQTMPYFSLTTGQGAAATANIALLGICLA